MSYVIAVILGVFSWTFLEYAIHNWVGHMLKGKTIFSKEHLKHHAVNGYFSPASKKALTAVMIMGIISPIAIAVVGVSVGLVYASGIVGMYLIYELVHRRAHTHAPRNAYARWVRRNHFYHHYMKPKMNHGVTNPIWDIVFKTHAEPGVIRVPERFVMDWLCDENGEVKPQYRDDYVLVPTGSKRAAARRQSQDEIGHDTQAAYAGEAPVA
ncbi:MAG: sterol desaturase family protein [Deltaproteobacteria bacterium]|nr:sterol desaturase family protein [bacterium]MCB9488186.1 sterol desaturase family protein [Deltaproteobacteria bacterium]